MVAERDRLMRRAYRRLLARTLVRMVRAAVEHPRRVRSSTAPCSIATIRAAAPQLEQVSRLVVAVQPGMRSVALLQQLVVAAHSPLQGADPQLLLEDLRRIAILLQGPQAR